MALSVPDKATPVSTEQEIGAEENTRKGIEGILGEETDKYSEQPGEIECRERGAGIGERPIEHDQQQQYTNDAKGGEKSEILIVGTLVGIGQTGVHDGQTGMKGIVDISSAYAEPRIVCDDGECSTPEF